MWFKRKNPRGQIVTNKLFARISQFDKRTLSLPIIYSCAGFYFDVFCALLHGKVRQHRRRVLNHWVSSLFSETSFSQAMSKPSLSQNRSQTTRESRNVSEYRLRMRARKTQTVDGASKPKYEVRNY